MWNGVECAFSVHLGLLRLAGVACLSEEFRQGLPFSVGWEPVIPPATHRAAQPFW